LQAGKYKGWKTTLIGYAVFSEWVVGAVLPMFTMRESYFEMVRAGYGDTYTDALMSLTPNWALYAMILLVIVGAVAGAYLGRAVLKKHFVKAGIA
jgi:energy-coupling factor transport system substrate-specific component